MRILQLLIRFYFPLLFPPFRILFSNTLNPCSIHLLPLDAFMAWTRTNLPFLPKLVFSRRKSSRESVRWEEICSMRKDGRPTGMINSFLQVFKCTQQHVALWTSFVVPTFYSYPVTGLNRPLGFRDVETPRISKQSAREGGKVVSPTHRPFFTPRRYQLWFAQNSNKRLYVPKFEVTGFRRKLGYVNFCSIMF